MTLDEDFQVWYKKDDQKNNFDRLFIFLLAERTKR